MTEYYIVLGELVFWMLLQLGWLCLATFALRTLGGKGAWLTFLGALGGVLSQLFWILNAVSDLYSSTAFSVELDSWLWRSVSLLGNVSGCVMIVGVFLIVSLAVQKKQRLEALELTGQISAS